MNTLIVLGLKDMLLSFNPKVYDPSAPLVKEEIHRYITEHGIDKDDVHSILVLRAPREDIVVEDLDPHYVF